MMNLASALGLSSLAVLLFLLPASVSHAADDAQLMDRLVRSYPDFLVGHDGSHLLWKDGTRMEFDDGKPAANFEDLLDNPSLKDMFYAPYVPGPVEKPPGVNEDPGRVRNEAFFLKMYGDCRKGEVAGNLVDIVWLPKKWGRKLRVTRLNGVAEQLARISSELDALPRKFDKYLIPPSGTLNCRVIAGTSRLSAHGTATAIDIASKHAHYWRWSKPDSAGRYRWKNDIPMEIVDVFERHGFIWGGKWYHFDTMHFEYRPELIGTGEPASQ